MSTMILPGAKVLAWVRLHTALIKKFSLPHLELATSLAPEGVLGFASSAPRSTQMPRAVLRPKAKGGGLG